jgi:hypothetical protein
MFLGDFNGGYPISKHCKYYDFDQSSEYEGEFKEWSRHGQGELTWHGEVFTGTWSEDMMDGEFVKIDKAGIKYQETWGKGRLIGSRK